MPIRDSGITIQKAGAEAYGDYNDWFREARSRGFSEGQAKQFWANAHPAAPKAAAPAAPGGGGGGPNWSDISGYFDKALASLSNDTEQMYQAGKRRSLSDIAMQSVNAGMANTLNMPAANVAYDEANRPATNLMLGQAKAGILTGLGQTAAGMYGQNLAAQTSTTNAQLGASTALATTGMNNQVDYAQQALQRYLGELKAKQPQINNNYYGMPQQTPTLTRP
jgi:hypothetical protein